MKLKLKDANRLFHQGTLALAHVESAGIRVDTDYLDSVISKLDTRINKISAKLRDDPIYDKWRRRFGSKANLGSRPQLGEILFDVMGIKYQGDRTKTGRYATDDAVLAKIDLPFVKKLRLLEDLKKVLSTNLIGLKRETVDGFVHPFFNLAGGGGGGGDDDKGGAASYRGSSSAINFQNQPNRDPVMAEIVRRCFVPRKGRCFVEADFGALEFVIAACFWKDSKMVAYASDPKKDIHRDMAMRCYMLKEGEWNKNSRFYAKNQFTFPKLYGSYWAKMARNLWKAIGEGDLKVGTDGASLFDHLKEKGIRELGECDSKVGPGAGCFDAHIKKVEKWFDSYFDEWYEAKEKWIGNYRERGWFQMPTGFVCRGIYSTNQLLNFPIQGSAFHCLLLSLIILQKELRKKKMKSMVVGQIHDCLLLDTVMEELQEVLGMLKRIMTEEIRKRWDWVICPLKVEVDVTEPDGTWFDKKPWVEKDGVWGPK